MSSLGVSHMIDTQKFLEYVFLTSIIEIIIDFSFNRLRWDQRKGKRVEMVFRPESALLG